MPSPTPGMTTLTAAANALKSVGSGVPINKQIDSVSNAITGTRRERTLSVQEEEYPSEAKNVLELLKIQVNKAINSLSKQRLEEHFYIQLVENLEIIEGFADRIVKFYHPKSELLTEEDQELTSSVKQAFAKARSEVVTFLAFERFTRKINLLESGYRKNPRMTRKEYRDRLQEIQSAVRKWEDELIPANPLLRHSAVVVRRKDKLKLKLERALNLSELKDHPGVVGETGLDILRVASGMVQHAKSQFEINQAVEMAVDANLSLQRSGKHFQEKGRAFNLIIQQSIAIFVNDQLRKLEKELAGPLFYVPGDVKMINQVALRMTRQMERLVTYFEFAESWAGPHTEDLFERIALAFEKIVGRASKAKDLTLDVVCQVNTPEETIDELAQVAARFHLTEILGKDLIDPKKIFNDLVGDEEDILEILEQLPDPCINSDQVLSYELLGRLYSRVRNILENGNVKPNILKNGEEALRRIEAYHLRLGMRFDIDGELAAMKVYLKEVEKQEILRFLKLLGVEPSVTSPERYAGYEDPSAYPFKGNQLFRVCKNYRIISNFIYNRLGELHSHPFLQKVVGGYVHEVDEHRGKLFLELNKRLNLPTTQLLPLKEIESMIRAKVGTPEKGKEREAKELWVLFESLNKPLHFIRESFIESLLTQCRIHRDCAESIMVNFANRDQTALEKVLISSLTEMIKEIARLHFEIDPSTIFELNKENQFYQDHEVSEVLPLYVEGLKTQRNEGVDLLQRLLAIVGSDESLAKIVESYTTRSLVEAPIATVKESLGIPSELPLISQVALKLEDATLFLSVDNKTKNCAITGYGQLVVKGPRTEDEQIEDVGSIVMKAEVRIINLTLEKPVISFSDLPYNACIAKHRESKVWNLF